MKSKLLSLLSFAAVLAASYTVQAQAAVFILPSASPKVTLAWNQSPDATVTGYFIYQGGQTATYTNRIQTGLTNIVVFPLAARGVPYFFTATAFNASGTESLPCNEVAYTAPVLPLSPNSLRTNVVQLAYNIESAPTPAGPWVQYASFGTNIESPAFFRGALQISLGNIPPLPPIPGQALVHPTLPVAR